MSANQKKAAVFLLMGQSNAVGHGIPMEEKDKITVPMRNVFGLSRELNQSFDNEELNWSGYISAGMNLAEEQDDTYSVANCLAQLWQDEMDAGNPHDLPDLHIVHIAIGAQGITEKFMWFPEREKKLIPGKLGTVDISLYPFTLRILALLDDSFKKLGKEPEYIGLHWRGGEEDTTLPLEELESKLEGLYRRIFDGFCSVLGRRIPIVLHRYAYEKKKMIKYPSGEGVVNLRFANSVFDRLAERYDNISQFDVRKAPHYNPQLENDGLFMEDLVHYSPKTNRWVADEILMDYISKRTK
ncbi:MAG: hypothetical protein E7487_04375 [Ruminococcaceae bacterium]|nr:hypothetical protein [Oscillospiraceae bacterium]